MGGKVGPPGGPAGEASSHLDDAGGLVARRRTHRGPRTTQPLDGHTHVKVALGVPRLNGPAWSPPARERDWLGRVKRVALRDPPCAAGSWRWAPAEGRAASAASLKELA